VLDVAVSEATMRRVAAGELPETLRVARPGRVIAFAKRDALATGYPEAVAAARAAGFGSVLRLAGGRAAVFHEGTLELAHAVPSSDPRGEIHARFEETAGLVARALGRLGVDARVGEVPGEYCPGQWTVSARGRVKVVGTAQRLVRGASLLGAVVLAQGGARVRSVLEDVNAALGLAWDPATAGAAEDEVPGLTVDDIERAVLDAYAARGDTLRDGALDDATVARARELAERMRL
jgi:lipoate-protein ligase A